MCPDTWSCQCRSALHHYMSMNEVIHIRSSIPKCIIDTSTNFLFSLSFRLLDVFWLLFTSTDGGVDVFDEMDTWLLSTHVGCQELDMTAGGLFWADLRRSGGTGACCSVVPFWWDAEECSNFIQVSSLASSLSNSNVCCSISRLNRSARMLAGTSHGEEADEVGTGCWEPTLKRMPAEGGSDFVGDRYRDDEHESPDALRNDWLKLGKLFNTVVRC